MSERDVRVVALRQRAGHFLVATAPDEPPWQAIMAIRRCPERRRCRADRRIGSSWRMIAMVRGRYPAANDESRVASSRHASLPSSKPEDYIGPV